MTRMAETGELRDLVAEGAEQLGVPGVAVGLLVDGQEHYVCHGITSVENPLDVDEHTLFHIGSTTKTMTATLVMRLVERGLIDLDATVRTYLPDFRVKNEDVSSRVTVRQTLNHTAGWDGDFFLDTGTGDDALARYVDAMSSLDQTSEFGGDASYNNASFSVAGRIVEVVTGGTFEQAMRTDVLDPIGMHETYSFLRDVITRRFAVGHRREADATIVARPYDMSRGNGPAGDLISTAPDQIRYARFHMGDGDRILSSDTMRLMQTPSASFSSGGSSVGLAWMINDHEGVRFVSHGGTTIGQQSSFEMVPERGYALTILSNAHHANVLNDEIAKYVRATFLGIVERDPEPIAVDATALAEFAGTYERPELFVTVSVDDARLVFTTGYTEAGREQLLKELGTLIPLPAPFGVHIVGVDEYFAYEGDYKGLRGKFLRTDDGRVTGIDLGGRVANRVG
jgi:CubicO group peptidase (beta-lactamase class C family)